MLNLTISLLLIKEKLLSFWFPMRMCFSFSMRSFSQLLQCLPRVLNQEDKLGLAQITRLVQGLSIDLSLSQVCLGLTKTGPRPLLLAADSTWIEIQPTQFLTMHRMALVVEEFHYLETKTQGFQGKVSLCLAVQEWAFKTIFRTSIWT